MKIEYDKILRKEWAYGKLSVEEYVNRLYEYNLYFREKCLSIRIDDSFSNRFVETSEEEYIIFKLKFL